MDSQADNRQIDPMENGHSSVSGSSWKQLLHESFLSTVALPFRPPYGLPTLTKRRKVCPTCFTIKK